MGGKTGVNHPLGKNMIGAFYQPRCVLIDTDTLNTLPDRELASGISGAIQGAAEGMRPRCPEFPLSLLCVAIPGCSPFMHERPDHT